MTIEKPPPEVTTESGDTQNAEDKKGLFDQYAEYNKTLRAWFVAYGVAGPVLFLTNAELAKSLARAGKLRELATLFLVGVASQIASALINKYSNYYAYYEADNPGVIPSYISRASQWLTHQMWIDIALDLLTVGTFGAAAWQLFVTSGG